MANFSKWFYRGEGNKTLVISNPETRQVLRLQKSKVTSKDQPNYTHNASRKESESLIQQEIEKSIELCKQVFIPLLGEKYVEPGSIVELPEEFMTSVKDLVTSANKERPKFRLSKEVNQHSKFGVSMPDFCFVSGVYANEVEGKTVPPTFCIEIKPKCGTLPTCAGLEKSLYRNVKECLCKYGLLQWTKVNKEGKYPQRSGYCPLDLFSSDIRRVWHALICLLKNPQNNFRIFQEGKLVYSGETMAPSDYGQMENGNTADKIPSNTGTYEHQSHLSPLEEALSHSFASHHSDNLNNYNLCGEIDGANLSSTTMLLATLLQLLIHDSNESSTSHHHHVDHHSLNHPVCEASQYNETNYSTGIPTWLMSKGLAFGQDGVLRKILDVQKLDKVGTDNAFSIFNTLCANGHKELVDLHILTFNQNSLKCSINASNNAKTNDNCDRTQTSANCDENINNGSIYTINDLSIASELDSLTKFLIAASANDCSIMISFQEVLNGSPKDLSCFEDVLTGKVYKYSIAIVDLDQKDSDRIPKYYKEYQDIVDNYLHFN